MDQQHVRSILLYEYWSLHLYISSIFFIIVNEDYTVDPMTEIRLRSDPIAITVTLLRDGVVGEGPEDIILTLMQDSRTQPNDNQLLIYDTIRIVLQDNDSMYVYNNLSLVVSSFHIITCSKMCAISNF